jgi:23S rRNA pseudouridine2605 synthase
LPVERLQKLLSNFGYASRREAETMIVEGRVAVNGVVRSELGSRADPDTDEITVDGVLVNRSQSRYFALNKPAGIVSTASDDLDRETVVDLVPIGDVLLHPVGRLDADSEGLIILTSDGHLTQLLTHPSHAVEKEYLVGIDARVAKRDAQRLVRGVKDAGELLRAVSVRETLPPGDSEDPAVSAWLLITMTQGRKREIRRMLAALGRRVLVLRRVRIGPLHLGDLGTGAFRELTEPEVAALYEAGRRASGHPPR